MTKHLARSWESVFSERLPQRLDELARTLSTALKCFRTRMAQRPNLNRAPTFKLVTRQVQSMEESIKDITEFKATLSERQKEASRIFVPAIASSMANAYACCVRERGKHMSLYIDLHRAQGS